MTVVFWVSRHPPLPAQIRRLRELLGNFTLNIIPQRIETAEDLIEEVARESSGDRAIIIPVLPLTIIAKLCELAKERGIEVWYAKMREILTTEDEDEAQRLVSEDCKRRVAVRYGRVIRVFEFEDFYRIKGVKLVLEPIA